VFYSISNCQEGLRGISFGNFLIKQVVEDLVKERTSLKTFVTLSPVPRFARGWRSARRRMRRLLLTPTDRASWPCSTTRLGRRAAVAEALEAALMRLAAHYFLNVKGADGRPDRSGGPLPLWATARGSSASTGWAIPRQGPARGARPDGATTATRSATSRRTTRPTRTTARWRPPSRLPAC
jgi:hypothetical protein